MGLGVLETWHWSLGAGDFCDDGRTFDKLDEEVSKW